jgi:hypothetical protein
MIVAALLAVAAQPIRGSGESVRDEFQAICEEMRVGGGTFYGDQRARAVESRLETPPEDPVEHLRLKGLLAVRYLELGEIDRSVSLLREILGSAQKEELTQEQIGVVLWNRGLAHLLAGENLNCVVDHNPDRCVFPFTARALHVLPEHARLAGDAFLDYLRIDPKRVEAAWLLNLSRILSADYPQGVPAAYRLPSEVLGDDLNGEAWGDLAPILGVDSFDLAGGAVMDDFDGDGLLDLVSSTWDPCDHMKAFRNNGRGGFEEVTEAWGLHEQLGGLNLSQADYDGDGRLDILVLRGGWLHEQGRVRNSLLRNELGEGEGRFVDVTRSAGLADPALPTQTAAWADYDLDGDLDLYVANEIVEDGKPLAAQLFQNNGEGTFRDVAAAAGVLNLLPSKGVGWGDYDDDGDPDLYVSNIGPNRLYRNLGDGTFVDATMEAGVAGEKRRSFGTWFFDFDNDGDLDLFVADYASTAEAVLASYFGAEPPDGQPLLYRNQGGRFEEVSRRWGLTRPLLPMGANFGDIDNDGWLDIYLGTGEPDYASIMPNVMYGNVGGLRFEEIVVAGGFGHLQKGHGIAFGDLDNDGDQDLFHQLGGFFAGDRFFNALYENPGSEASWITLRLEGKGKNRFGVGARIRVRVRTASGERSIHLVGGTGGSFGGSSSQQEIGLGAALEILDVTIHWPAGERQIYPAVPLNGIYRAVQGRSELLPVELPSSPSSALH